MINLLEEPEIRYKGLLDKGEELTTNEVIYLHMKGVDKTVLRKTAKLSKTGLESILERMDWLIENHKKVVDKMGAITKFNMTKERAEQLKAEGKNKSEIAKLAGVGLSTYLHHEKKWNGDQPKKVAANEEYISLLEQLKEQVKQKDGTIEKLHKKIEQLEQDKLDLHAAASDVEKEVSAVEFMERESELMIDADVWKLRAMQYKTDNQRLNDNLSETRQELAKYKGENVLAKAFIKAVL